MTRAMWSGTSTLRPAESTTSRAKAVPNGIVSSNKNKDARPARPSRARLCSGRPVRALGPHQAPDRAEFAAGRATRMRFNRPIETDQPLAGRRDDGAAAAAAAGFGRDRRLTQRMIDLLDQQPGAAIGHAQRARGRRDRAGRADRLQERDLPRPDTVAVLEIDADGQARAGHGIGLLRQERGQSRPYELQRQATLAVCSSRRSMCAPAGASAPDRKAAIFRWILPDVKRRRRRANHSPDSVRSCATRDCAVSRIGALMAPKPAYPRRSTISRKKRSLKLRV